MLKRFSGIVVLLAAVLITLPACGKKAAAPTVPDSTPAPIPPTPKPLPNPNPGTGGTQTPTQPLDPSLPYPPTQKPLFANVVAVAAIRDANMLNLKQIGLAFHNANDTLGAFPMGIADKNGKIGLSWRVALLPYLEQQALYNAFKLDEPWDSEHNKKLIPQMPKIYGPARTDTNGYTFYRSFSGKDAFMPPPTMALTAGKVISGVKMAAIPDGLSNTLFVAEAYDPVIWTKPDELAFTPGTAPKLGGGVFSTGFCALFGDGSARFLPMNLTPTELSNLIQTNDGNIVNLP
ncbi:MAG: DUF1559 domain-containing protein [Planctomycetes bacterium]|nr:DUF1559 domain-containing protein [Planctomycetota bacterium]